MGSNDGLPDAVPEATPPRVFAGGVLMGLANLVPGVSGGTMILALGLYDRFIESVADVARFRWNFKAISFLAILAVGLAVAILGLATPAVWLVREHRWLAYSLFIGMTLGGVPLLWAIVRPLNGAVAASALVGFAAMAAVAFGLQSTALPQSVPVFVGAGALAASSMILPGVSGSYVLLILGLYDVVVGSVRPSALSADFMGSLGVIIPVGVGAAVGIGLLANGLRWFLHRFERPSHAFLLGLLVGSVLGLWPFQGPAWPDLADEPRLDAVKALVAGASLDEIAAETGVTFDANEAARLSETFAGRESMELELMALDLDPYRPTVPRILISLATLAFGFVLTLALGGMGKGR